MLSLILFITILTATTLYSQSPPSPLFFSFPIQLSSQRYPKVSYLGSSPPQPQATYSTTTTTGQGTHHHHYHRPRRPSPPQPPLRTASTSPPTRLPVPLPRLAESPTISISCGVDNSLFPPPITEWKRWFRHHTDWQKPSLSTGGNILKTIILTASTFLVGSSLSATTPFPHPLTTSASPGRHTAGGTTSRRRAAASKCLWSAAKNTVIFTDCSFKCWRRVLIYQCRNEGLTHLLSVPLRPPIKSIYHLNDLPSSILITIP